MKIKCECGGRLRIVVKEVHKVYYEIKKDGSLENEDGDCDGQEITLECTECNNVYEFKEDEVFEIENRPKLFIRWFSKDSRGLGELIAQNINELEIAKSNKI